MEPRGWRCTRSRDAGRVDTGEHAQGQCHGSDGHGCGRRCDGHEVCDAAERATGLAWRTGACSMKALTWHGRTDIRCDNVPDPTIIDPTDAIVRITTTAICGSDLHLYDGFNPFMEPGDILGHEPMGIVEEVGSEVKR